MTTSSPPRFEDLLELVPDGTDGEQAWRSVHADGNLNGRVFGGQLLAHAVAAALDGSHDRHLGSLRLTFLQGACMNAPVRWQAQTLQQGSRYTSRHLQATQDSPQGQRLIADAQVTLQLPASGGLAHAEPMPAGLPQPEELPTLADLADRIATATGRRYELQSREHIDLRLIEADEFLLQPAARAGLRFWVRARHRLADRPALHVAALAYLSDFWFNYASLAPHLGIDGSRERVYVASLNHAMWFMAPCRADEWLLFDITSPMAGDGRGLSWGRIHRRDGTLVACAAQEMVCTVRAPG